MQPAIGYRAQRRQQQCRYAFPDGRPVVSGPIPNHQHLARREVQALERKLDAVQTK